jgi:hypothetical protein
MEELTVELLSPERVTELWPELRPLLQAACDSNEIAKDEIEPGDIYILAQLDMCAVFAMFDEDGLGFVLVIQFTEINGRRGADVIAMGGRSILKFKAAFWNSILNWLRANDIRFLDAYATERLGKLYMNKFGFTKSCSYVRMTL